MPKTLRALRGATTVDDDTRADITARVGELLDELVERNGIEPDDWVSVLFSATQDLHAMFPAEAARDWGLVGVPLMGASELDVAGATPRCIRVLVHLHTDRPRDELRHVYLHGAASLPHTLPQ